MDTGFLVFFLTFVVTSQRGGELHEFPSSLKQIRFYGRLHISCRTAVKICQLTPAGRGLDAATCGGLDRIVDPKSGFSSLREKRECQKLSLSIYLWARSALIVETNYVHSVDREIRQVNQIRFQGSLRGRSRSQGAETELHRPKWPSVAHGQDNIQREVKVNGV